MNQNVGDTDTVVRYVLAVIFILLGFIFNPWWFLLAFIAILTAFLGWCGLYALLGINTCKSKELQTTNIPSTTAPSQSTANITTESAAASMNIQTTNTPASTGDQIDSLAAEHKMIPAPVSKPRAKPKKSKPKKTVKKAAKKPVKKKKK